MSIIEDYKNLNKGFNKTETITAFTPKPNDKDYDRGYINRFFVQKTNDKNAPIFEISPKTYLKLSQKPEFNIVNIRWRIKGPLETIYTNEGEIIDFGVRESNRKVILLQKEKLPGLIYRLTNYLQFYRQ